MAAAPSFVVRLGVPFHSYDRCSAKSNFLFLSFQTEVGWSRRVSSTVGSPKTGRSLATGWGYDDSESPTLIGSNEDSKCGAGRNGM